MSLAYFQSMAETLHLLENPANAAHLANSIAEHKAGKAVRRLGRTPGIAVRDTLQVPRESTAASAPVRPMSMPSTIMCPLPAW